MKNPVRGTCQLQFSFYTDLGKYKEIAIPTVLEGQKYLVLVVLVSPLTGISGRPANGHWCVQWLLGKVVANKIFPGKVIKLDEVLGKSQDTFCHLSFPARFSIPFHLLRPSWVGPRYQGPFSSVLVFAQPMLSYRSSDLKLGWAFKCVWISRSLCIAEVILLLISF